MGFASQGPVRTGLHFLSIARRKIAEADKRCGLPNRRIAFATACCEQFVGSVGYDAGAANWQMVPIGSIHLPQNGTEKAGVRA